MRAQEMAADLDPSVLRDAFARILAHELRTPVTTIFGGAQLLLEASLSAETHREAARMVASEAERLYRTVEDLLVLARFDDTIEGGDAPVLLQRFLPALIGAERGRFPPTPFVVDVPESLPAVRGRQSYIEQVVRHLLTSAARFSPAGEPVTTSAEVSGSHVEVRVSDRGRPIATAEASSMFDLFAHTPRSTGDASGANLGLFVARRLVRAMGGEIRAVTGSVPALEFTLRVYVDED